MSEIRDALIAGDGSETGVGGVKEKKIKKGKKGNTAGG